MTENSQKTPSAKSNAERQAEYQKRKKANEQARETVIHETISCLTNVIGRGVNDQSISDLITVILAYQEEHGASISHGMNASITKLKEVSEAVKTKENSTKYYPDGTIKLL